MDDEEKEITIWFQDQIKTEIDGGLIKVTGISASENIIDTSSASQDEKINKLVDKIEHMENIDLTRIELPEEYYYSCLPLCLLDAVFSIGVRYSSTRNVVKRYCDKYHIDEFRKPESNAETGDQIHTINDLIDNISYLGAMKFAANVIENKQRTSTKSGILKASAVLQCADKLQRAKIQTIQNFNDAMNDPERAQKIESDFKSVSGQTSGLSFSYLKMLCGDEDQAKPDRHILRFLSKTLGYKVSAEEAENLFLGIVKKLQRTYSNLTVRQLDYMIWGAMR